MSATVWDTICIIGLVEARNDYCQIFHCWKCLIGGVKNENSIKVPDYLFNQNMPGMRYMLQLLVLTGKTVMENQRWYLWHTHTQWRLSHFNGVLFEKV